MSKYDSVYRGWMELPKIVVEAKDKNNDELTSILHDFMEKMDKAYNRRFEKYIKKAFENIEAKEKAKLN